MADAPSLAALNRIEEQLLVARLDAVRSAISHAGEKGRALEHQVYSLIRSILPAEYGLSTGFIVHHTDTGPRLSRQLDIIIYDAVRGGPIVSLESCHVFPLEAVYGYVEVKASLQSSSDDAEKFAENSLETCLQRNLELRQMRERRFRVPSLMIEHGFDLVRPNWLSIRAFVFAFEAEGAVARDLPKLAQRMADVSKRLGPPAHLHGVFIAGHGFAFTAAVDAATAQTHDYYHVACTTAHPLVAFKMQLLESLSRFPRPRADWTIALDQYFDAQPVWQWLTPVEK